MTSTVTIRRVEGTAQSVCVDELAVEEPLEIRIAAVFNGRYQTRPLSLTMRTPGQDEDLAAGFLLTEGIVRRPEQVRCRQVSPNVVRAELDASVSVDPGRFARHFYATSSCGVCGKASLEALADLQGETGPPPGTPVFDAVNIHRLPARLRCRQPEFEHTGGLHAAALCTPGGEIESVREDVGRHNAVDKLLGAAFLAGRTPLHDRLLFVSGRASFELLQKALLGGVAGLAAVGAPSSLAVSLAVEFGLTLIGFVRDNRFNVYSGADRIRFPESYEVTRSS